MALREDPTQDQERTILSPRRAIERTGTFALTLLISAYQVSLSPLLIGGCRHWPTCSDYALEALREHGLRRGIRLALNRLGRCRPGGSMGYDPVPRPGE